jgi:hypothetical protein
MVGVVSMVDVALPDAATTEAEDFAAASVTGTPAEPHGALLAGDVPSAAADAALVEAHGPSVVADAPSAAADVASVEVDMPSAVADMPSLAADTEAASMAGAVMVVADMVVMVVGTGRFHHDSKLSRPTAFAVGRCVLGAGKHIGESPRSERHHVKLVQIWAIYMTTPQEFRG